MKTSQGPQRSSRNALAAAAAALLIGACGHQEGKARPAVGSAGAAATTSPAGEEKVLNIYNWADYIDPSLVPAFAKEYGIKVNYDVFDSNDLLETKLLTGKSGYDIVVPTSTFMQRQIQVGVYQKLDKTLLPNLKNLDANLSRRVGVNDPGNQFSVIYFWGTSGITYDEEKIAAAMPNAPMESYAMLYDSSVIKRFKDCGVAILDQPDEVVETVLMYLGKDPMSESLADLKAAETVLQSIRPYVHYINAPEYGERLANGEICIALTWGGDANQARLRAKEAGRNTKFGYILPKEGTIMYFDMVAIPADAPHPKNAHLFINYLLRPDVAAKNSNFMHIAVANAAAYTLVDSSVYGDRNVYPREDQAVHFYPMTLHSQSYTRELNRTWTRFKTGR